MPDTPRAMESIEQKRLALRFLVSGPWASLRNRRPCLGPGRRHPLEISPNTALAKLPGRPERLSKAARGREEREKQAQDRRRPWQREPRVGGGKGTAQRALGKPRLQIHRPLPGLPKRFRHLFRFGGGVRRRSPHSSFEKLGNKKSTQGLEAQGRQMRKTQICTAERRKLQLLRVSFAEWAAAA